jgi:hypothetical protein
VSGRIDVDGIFAERLSKRLEDLQLDWFDESYEASVNGNPKRGNYLTGMADRIPAIFLALRDLREG